jgi:conjugal transfer pilus assembly protein TraA
MKEVSMNSKSMSIRQWAFLAVMLAPVSAFAGTTGAEFLNLYTWIMGIASGYAARAISIAAIVIGALMSLGKGSPMPILAGIGFAVFLAYLPAVVNGVLSATI